MGLASMFGLGFLVGSVITAIIFRFFMVGVLHVDKSDPDDAPYMFLEISKGVDSITSKKHVILKVDTKNFIPHK